MSIDPGRPVGHDITVDCDNFDQFLSCYHAGMVGTIETAAILGWRIIKDRLPNIKMVCIRRSVEDVLQSLKFQGVVFDGLEEELKIRDAMLDSACEAGAIAISYSDLNVPSVAEWLFEHCLDRPFDPEWYRTFRDVNIQIDIHKQLRRIADREPQLSALRASVEMENKKLCATLN